MIKRIAITSGEPAGIGPDLCCQLQPTAGVEFVIIGDKRVLEERAKLLRSQSIATQQPENWELFDQSTPKEGISLLHCATHTDVQVGKLEKSNANYVLTLLDHAIDGCVQGYFDAMVTAPVHKGIINDAGIAFSGHTEYLQHAANAQEVVMMLASKKMKVALVTTHLPLKSVADAITETKLIDVCHILHNDLYNKFGISAPRVLVAGLNPHAGEGGHLGTEERDLITPTLQKLNQRGLNLVGPLPADTLFTAKYLDQADAVLAMYHDQGLPVLKYQGFGSAANITLGLPFIRTSVDHGTALDLAGTDQVETGSFLTAIDYALTMAENKR